MSSKAMAIGVDLAAREGNVTGICILGGESRLKAVIGDKELIREIMEVIPEIIAVDAPLTLPGGRCCFSGGCDCRYRGKNTRKADRELISIGYRVFPPGFSYMKDLTIRGIRLRGLLEKKFRVIEVHPRTSLLALDWKEADVHRYLKEKGHRRLKPKSKHELDAMVCAATALLHLEGKTTLIGDEGEGQIVIPKI